MLGTGCRYWYHVQHHQTDTRGDGMQWIVSLLIATAMTLGSYTARAAGDSKAADLLAQARAAIGGEKQIGKVQGLSCNGTIQRLVGDRQIAGDLTLDVQCRTGCCAPRASARWAMARS